MTIETKYSIGDEVWVRRNNQPTIAQVVSVLVNRELIKVKGQSRIYEIEKKYKPSTPDYAEMLKAIRGENVGIMGEMPCKSEAE